MAIKLELNSKVILDKTFPGVDNGYAPFEVDQFLDLIIRDYKLIESNQLLSQKEIDATNSKLTDLNEKVKLLELENEHLKNKLEGLQGVNNITEDNLDLVKRIRVLEKYLWNHGTNPNTIK